MQRSDPHYWYGRLALGIALLLLVGSRRIVGPLAVVLGTLGFVLAIRSVGPVVRLIKRGRHAHRSWGEEASRIFQRASLPRRIFYLLSAVAEADGPISRDERMTVRHFVLERLGIRVPDRELREWETHPLKVEDRAGLAARIATGLEEAEIDTVFCWCCLVTFADGKFQEQEHTALHDVRKGFGLSGPRARMLFHLARTQYLHAEKTGGGFDGGSTRTSRPADARTEAFATLGLPSDSTREQIRRRHRELVKRFHPDAHTHLGPTAQREAGDRFREIQRAYEILTED